MNLFDPTSNKAFEYKTSLGGEMSEVSKWINEVQLMRKEHEAELEKERQRSNVLVGCLKKVSACLADMHQRKGCLFEDGTLKPEYVECMACWAFQESGILEALKKWEGLGGVK